MTEHTISWQLKSAAEKNADRIALQFPDEELTLNYIEMKERIDQVSKALLGIGLKKGDHIGIWSTNSSHWVFLALGAAQIGVVFVPINAAYKSKELAYIVHDMDVKVLFAMDQMKGVSCVSRLRRFYKDGKLDTEGFPSLCDIYSMSDDPLENIKGWNDLIRMADSVTDSQLDEAVSLVTGNDIYSIQATSGTTAMPKGARLYQKGVLYTAGCYAQLLHLEQEDMTCVPLPLFHCFGNVLTLLGGLLSGSSTVYMSHFSARSMLEFLEKEKCTCVMGVPTMFTAMMAQPDFDSSKYMVKKAGMGGSYAPPSLAQAITEKFNCPGVVIGYGLSEAASLVTLSDIRDPASKRLGTTGKALPDLEVSLYDADTGRISKTLPQGEIICRGKGIMQDYYNNPKETENALQADGWLHTGDLGMFDEEGYLRVVGRIKDIIVRSGENISPSQIEALLLELEEIQDVQCTGVPDSFRGEEVAAFVILKEGYQLSAETVRTYVEANMAKYKVPKYVFFVNSFPMNAAGKVLKKELTQMALEIIQEK